MQSIEKDYRRSIKGFQLDLLCRSNSAKISNIDFLKQYKSEGLREALKTEILNDNFAEV